MYDHEYCVSMFLKLHLQAEHVFYRCTHPKRVNDDEITAGKANTIYSALSNEIEKCGWIESLSGFESDEASIIIGHKKNASKLKRDNPKIISIHCDNHILALATFPFFRA